MLPPSAGQGFWHEHVVQKGNLHHRWVSPERKIGFLLSKLELILNFYEHYSLKESNRKFIVKIFMYTNK